MICWVKNMKYIICWKPFWRAYRSTSARVPAANAQCTWTWRKQDLQRYIWIPDSDISEKISPICHSSTPQCDNSHSRHVTEIYVHTSSVTSQLTQLVFATKHNSYSHVPRGPCLFVSAKHRTALNCFPWLSSVHLFWSIVLSFSHFNLCPPLNIKTSTPSSSLKTIISQPPCQNLYF